MAVKKVLCAECKHECRHHAIAENHNLGTTHCTKLDCECKEYVGRGNHYDVND